MSALLVRTLDVVAQGVYLLQHSRATRLALAGIVLLSIFVTALARPTFNEDSKVYTVPLRDLSSTNVGRYVRITGTLVPQASYQTQLSIGGLRLEGSRFIPMLGEGAYDPLFVLDQNLPSVPETGAPLTLIGKLVPGTGQQPPYFLEVGDPPDVALMNSLARLGVVGLALLIAAFGLIWYVRRSDYALGVPVGGSSAPASAPPLLWFGGMGRNYGEISLRQEPATFIASRAEAQFVSARQPGLWSVTLRRLLSADTAVVATRYGALAAARIEFEDERGLRRRAVLATNSSPARDALVEALRFVGLQN